MRSVPEAHERRAGVVWLRVRDACRLRADLTMWNVKGRHQERRPLGVRRDRGRGRDRWGRDGAGSGGWDLPDPAAGPNLGRVMVVPAAGVDLGRVSAGWTGGFVICNEIRERAAKLETVCLIKVLAAWVRGWERPLRQIRTTAIMSSPSRSHDLHVHINSRGWHGYTRAVIPSTY